MHSIHTINPIEYIRDNPASSFQIIFVTERSITFWTGWDFLTITDSDGNFFTLLGINAATATAEYDKALSYANEGKEEGSLHLMAVPTCLIG